MRILTRALAALLLLSGAAMAQSLPSGNFGTGLVVTITQDHSAAGLPSSSRRAIVNTVLSPSVTTTNIWENDSSFLELQGPGVASGEINMKHSYFQVDSGASATQAEDFEASTLNNGTIGAFNDYLAIFTNGAAGIVTGAHIGYKYAILNQNTTVASIAQSIAVDCEAMTGAGTVPTQTYCIRNADVAASISTLGHVIIGSLSPASATIGFQVSSPDNNSGNFAMLLKNQAGTNLFGVNNAGGLLVSGTNAVSCAAASVSLTTLVVTNGIVTHC